MMTMKVVLVSFLALLGLCQGSWAAEIDVANGSSTIAQRGHLITITVTFDVGPSPAQSGTTEVKTVSASCNRNRTGWRADLADELEAKIQGAASSYDLQRTLEADTAYQNLLTTLQGRVD